MGELHKWNCNLYLILGNNATRWIEYNSHGGTDGSMISTSSLGGGVDGTDVSDGDKITALQKFRNTEETDIGLLMMGDGITNNQPWNLFQYVNREKIVWYSFHQNWCC